MAASNMGRFIMFLISAGGLFAGMILLLEVGRRLGRRRHGRDEEGARAGLGAVEGAVFALLGLLIAFTFSSAASRFDTRRQLIVQEGNAIGTAWLRLDLLLSSAQPELRDLFRRFLDRPRVPSARHHSHRCVRPGARGSAPKYAMSIRSAVYFQ